MQAPDHIADLLFKYLRNELSGEEEKQLSQWRHESERNEELFERLTDPDQVRELMQGLYSRKRSWDKIIAQAPELKHSKVIRHEWKWPFSVAATVISILGITAVILAVSFNYLSDKKKETKVVAAADTTRNYFLPGTYKAILTLSNGEKIILDTTKNQKDPRRFGNNIKALSHGSLLYETSPQNTTAGDVFNTLETPRGGEFQLSLPDGSKVWLNAASSIRYPVVFKGNERKVEVSGEVYFEVSKNEHAPFIVSAGDTRVQVLGTHFNVSAYNDEPSIDITLLEGSIKTTAGAESRIIKPGEQARIEKGKTSPEIDVVELADVNNIVSWKNGRIFFKDADIPSIMRMVSRWYDIDVVYKGNIPLRSLTGGLSRNANLSELLKVFELNKIHFTVEGNKITITP
jgi:transmembrane sensor